MTTPHRRVPLVGTAAILLALLSASILIDVTGAEQAYAADEPPFAVGIRNAAGQNYTIACSNQPGRINSYGTSVSTETIADHWYRVEGSTTQRFRTLFDRVDATTAHAGRCQTGDTATLTGDGDLSARLYIHTNVTDTTGVFTIGLLPERFVVTEELDLVVINLLEDGSQWVKMGTPGHGRRILLEQVNQQWITARLQKRGTTCSFYIDLASGSTKNLGQNTCGSPTDVGHIVVNARSREGASLESGFITVEDIHWTQR